MGNFQILGHAAHRQEDDSIPLAACCVEETASALQNFSPSPVSLNSLYGDALEHQRKPITEEDEEAKA